MDTKSELLANGFKSLYLRKDHILNKQFNKLWNINMIY